MKIVGMMRIKDEARWIEQVLCGALAICDLIYIFDDHSTDGTVEICRSFKDSVVLFPSPFAGLDEARDKNWLFDQVKQSGADWCLSIDGDELISDQDDTLLATAHGKRSNCVSLRIVYLWNRPDQVRTDGVYGNFWRPSFFRVRPTDSFRTTENGGNFHCGNVPRQFVGATRCSGARLLHFGYMHEADRRRKFDWYNQHDPENAAEDRYQHIVQGDTCGPAASEILLHAGPLRLEDVNGL